MYRQTVMEQSPVQFSEVKHTDRLEKMCATFIMSCIVIFPENR